MANRRMQRTALLAGSVAGGLAALSAGPVVAQDARTVTQLETVVVTATRRAESQQTVPVAVTAVSAEQIAAAGLRDTTALQQVAPSLVITVSNSETTGGVLRIRGVGTQGQNLGLEAAVGVFVDGVYRSRPALALNDLLDVRQIEVLRGPQGTLFGKNTSAGAIILTTNPPSFEPGGEVLVGLGPDGQRRIQGSLAGPIADNLLAFRISGVMNERDGYIRDVKLDRRYNDRDRVSLRAQLLVTPTPDLSLRLIADHIEKSELCCAAPYVLNGVRAGLITSLGGTVFNPTRQNDFLVATNTPVRSDTEEYGFSAQMDWNTAIGDLKVIASTRQFIASRDADVDFLDLDLANLLNEVTKDRLNSMEATVQNQTGRLDWLVGAFWFDTRLNNPSTQVIGRDLGRYQAGVTGRAIAGLYAAGDGDQLRRFYQTGDGWSVFAHGTLSITDTLKATGGLRYLEESKVGGGEFVTRIGASCTSPLVPAAARVFCATRNYQAAFTDDATTWSAALSWRITPEIMAYASASHGYKAGGISLDRDAGNRTRQTFLPETSDNVELGLKTEWFDRRLQINLTAFQLEFTDFQRTVFTGTETLLSNQGEVTSEGVELETRWFATPKLALNSSVTFADTQYGSNVTDLTIANRALNAAPKWTAQAGFLYERPIKGEISFLASGNARYQSRTTTGADLDPLKSQKGYTLVNGRIGLRHEGHDAELVLWGSNLTDERYRIVTFNATLQPGSLQAYMGEPRAWGLELSKRF
jgi:iron complex outermembrane receptor protein